MGIFPPLNRFRVSDFLYFFSPLSLTEEEEEEEEPLLGDGGRPESLS